jgi:hypothetical protein
MRAGNSGIGIGSAHTTQLRVPNVASCWRMHPFSAASPPDSQQSLKPPAGILSMISSFRHHASQLLGPSKICAHARTGHFVMVGASRRILQHEVCSCFFAAAAASAAFFASAMRTSAVVLSGASSDLTGCLLLPHLRSDLLLLTLHLTPGHSIARLL